jgi:hypothetical protein
MYLVEPLLQKKQKKLKQKHTLPSSSIQGLCRVLLRFEQYIVFEMAEQNAFDLLNDDDVAPEQGSPKQPVDETISQPLMVVTADEQSDEAWTDVSSTKTRKLAPQFTLSKQNFGPDKDRSSLPTPEAKKKGTAGTHY